MAWQSGGGSGYPGVTSDGNNGLVVQHELGVGDRNAALVPDFSAIFGKLFLTDAPGNNVDGDEVLAVSQLQPVPSGGFGPPMIVLARQGDVSAQDYSRPMVRLVDTTASAQPVFQLIKQNVVMLELGVKPAVTGALSTVADAAAKAVLTSIIAALTGVKVATDGTT